LEQNWSISTDKVPLLVHTKILYGLYTDCTDPLKVDTSQEEENNNTVTTLPSSTTMACLMLRTDYCSYGSSTAMYRSIKVLSTCPLYKNSMSFSVNTHFSLQIKKKQFAGLIMC
jgi:hypothetical protein